MGLWELRVRRENAVEAIAVGLAYPATVSRIERQPVVFRPSATARVARGRGLFDGGLRSIPGEPVVVAAAAEVSGLVTLSLARKVAMRPALGLRAVAERVIRHAICALVALLWAATVSLVAVFPRPEDEPTLSVERAGALLGLGRSAAYAAVRAGQIPVLRFNERTLRVPTAALRQLVGIAPALDDGRPRNTDECVVPIRSRAE